jgi:TolB-like protein
MLNLLARVEALKVAARTSSFAFRNKDMDIAQSVRSSMWRLCSNGRERCGERA